MKGRARPSRRQRRKAKTEPAICGLTRALIRMSDDRGKGEHIPCRPCRARRKASGGSSDTPKVEARENALVIIA